MSELTELQHASFDQQTSKTVQLHDLPKITWLTCSLIHADEVRQVTLRGLPRLQTLKMIPINADGSIEQIPYVAKIDDELLTEVAAMPWLESLELTHTAIHDTALPQLAALPKLRSVTITGPNVSPEALQQLRESLRR